MKLSNIKEPVRGTKYCFRCERPMTDYVTGRGDKLYCSNFCKDKENNSIQRLELLMEGIDMRLEALGDRVSGISGANQTLNKELVDHLILIERKIDEQL